MECPLCFAELAAEEFWELAGCGHRACISCLQQYLRVEITESRVCISCPECPEPMHPNGKEIHRRLPPLSTIVCGRAAPDTTCRTRCTRGCSEREKCCRWVQRVAKLLFEMCVSLCRNTKYQRRRCSAREVRRFYG